jgi:hypothetical protein
MKNIVSLLLIALFFSSCEKTLDLNYKTNQPTITIEGNITDLSGPYFVKVTKSISLSDIGSYPTIDDAKVTVSDNAGNSEVLSPQGNGLYRTNTLRGTEGRTYTLTVETGGQKYTAQSTMPKKVTFDAIQVEPVTFGGDLEYNLIPIYQDPISKGDNYKFLLSINNKLINQHLVLNDEVKNGTQNTQKLEINDDDLKLKAGDLVNIEMQCIDKKVSLYYTTLALIGNSGPGGGTTPNNPPSNISNGALGIFSAHTVSIRQVNIQ